MGNGSQVGLEPQVHGKDCLRPNVHSEAKELIPGEVRDPDFVIEALDGMDAVFHYAAIGIGQT